MKGTIDDIARYSEIYRPTALTGSQQRRVGWNARSRDCRDPPGGRFAEVRHDFGNSWSPYQLVTVQQRAAGQQISPCIDDAADQSGRDIVVHQTRQIFRRESNVERVTTSPATSTGTTMVTMSWPSTTASEDTASRSSRFDARPGQIIRFALAGFRSGPASCSSSVAVGSIQCDGDTADQLDRI